jgi:hypothetical protein
MPGQPEEEVTSLDTMYGPAPFHQFAISFGAAHCIIGVTEFDPQVSEDASIEERYDRSIEGLAEMQERTLIQDERVESSGYTGREAVVEVKGKVIVHTRLFLVGDRLYQINITYPPDYVSPKAVAYYLDSLRIDYRPGDET